MSDFARFAQMLLNGGELDGKRYLSPATFTAMTTDHIGPEFGVERDYFYFLGDGFGFGYGFGIRTDPGKAVPPPPARSARSNGTAPAAPISWSIRPTTCSSFCWKIRRPSALASSRR